MAAVALSVTTTGRIDRVRVGGAIRSLGADVVTVDIQGIVGSLIANSGVHAHGQRSDALHTARLLPGLEPHAVSVDHGRGIVVCP